MIGHSVATLAALSVAPANEVNLSGTFVDPNWSHDYAIDPATAQAGWIFNISGNVQRYILGIITEFSPTPDEWFNPNGSPDATYYIRATSVSGGAPTAGDTLGVVHSLAAQRSWTWSQSGVGSASGVILVEIFSDAGGTNLLASGYYSASASVDGTL